MGADGADLGRLLADVDVAAVRALPDAVAVAREDEPVLQVREQLAIPLLVLLFDGGDALKERGDMVEALFARLLCEFGVHFRPLVILALRGVEQVVRRRADAVVQQLEPDLRVLLLVVGGLLKERRDLHVALFFGLRGVVAVLVARLRFAGEGCHQVGFGLASF